MMSSKSQGMGRRLTLSDLNNDVLLEICDHLAASVQTHYNPSHRRPVKTTLKSLSSVNRRLRTLLGPVLMRSIDLSKPEPQKEKNGWVVARRAIDGLMENSSLLESIQSLRVDLYGHRWENDYALAEELSHLVAFLRRLPKMRLLRLNIPHEYMFEFEKSFNASADSSTISFDNLTTLYLEYRMKFLLDYCPSLQRLAIYNTGDDVRLYSLNFPQSFALLSSITHVETDAAWPLEIAHIATVFPFLRYLAIPGRSDWWSLRKMLAELNRGCKELRILVLPDIIDISRRSSIYAVLGNPFISPEDKDAYGRYVEWRERAQNKAVGQVFEACVELEECWLGEYDVARVVLRDASSDGHVKSGKETHNERVSHEHGSGSVPEHASVAAEAEVYGNDREEREVTDMFTDVIADVGSEIDDDYWELTLRVAEGTSWTWSRSGSADFVGRKDRLLF